MEINQVYELIDEDLHRAETLMHETIQSSIRLIPEVGDYILNSGGKRLRPTMVILSSRLCDYRGEYLPVLACAFEYIHTATLLHDDVMDEADVRRGKTATNVVWGNRTSIMAGDIFYARATSILIDLSNNGYSNVLKILTDTVNRMAEGEALQLSKTNKVATSQEDYLEIITNKTASLISAACQAGAILGNAPKDTEAALTQFGLKCGLAFQLTDDSLDYTCSEEEFGKTIGKDLQEGKVTLPLIHSLTMCNVHEKERAEEIIVDPTVSAKDLSFIRHLFSKYNGIDYTFDLAHKYIEEAKDHLNTLFPPSPEKDALLCIADYILNRRV